jgi:hypothetical protein
MEPRNQPCPPNWSLPVRGEKRRRYVRTELDAGGIRISIGPRAGVFPWLTAPLLAAWWPALGWVGGEIIARRIPWPAPMLFACMWWIGVFTVLVWASRGLMFELCGRTEIEISSRKLTRSAVLFAKCGRRRRVFEVSRISNVRVQTRRMRSNLIDRSIVFDYGGKTIRLTPQIGKTEAEQLLSGLLRSLQRESISTTG